MYVAVLDCSARNALAWWFSLMRRENVKQSSEQGNPALLLADERSRHDHFVATIKKMPFPLNNREFVNRLVCVADINGDLLIMCVPVDNVIDYGMNTRTVRGVSRALVRFTPYGESHCKVTYIQYLDAGGRIPTFVVNAKIPLALGAVGDLRDAFQRDDEIDKLERDELARVIKDEPQTYTARELDLLRIARDQLASIKEDEMRELQSPDSLVAMSHVFVEGSREAVLRAITVIDETVETCAAFETNLMDRWHMKESQQNGEIERQVIEKTGLASVFQLVLDLGIPGFAPREFVMQNVWTWEREGKLAMIQVSTEHERFPVRNQFVRAEVTAFWTYEQLAPLNGIPQTQATYAVKVDMKGVIPKWVPVMLGVDELMYLSRIRLNFERSLEVDGATRAQNVEMITGHAEEYSEEEKALLEDGEKHFTDFQEMKAKSLEMASPLTAAKIAHRSGDNHAWGRATTTVRASPKEVLAYLWDTMRRSARQEDDLEKSVDERINGHNQLGYTKRLTPKIIADREFLGRDVWKKGGEGFVYVTTPEESEARPITDSVVRGKYPSAMKIKRKNDMETTLEYVIHPDAGGSLPSFIMNRYLGSNLSYVTEIQEYFQALRGLEEWDADDVRAVGEVMCIKTKAEKHPENKQSARMRELFKKQTALREIGERYEFFEGMMARVVRNTLKPAGDVKSKLCSVSLKEGETIGRGLAMALASNLTADAAVDGWILKHRSLGELDRTEAWFR